MLKSRALAERVASALYLAQTDFVAPGDPSVVDRLSGRAGAGTIARDASVLKERNEEAVDLILGGLSVQPVLQSSIVRIKFTSTSPEWAKRISIGVGEQFEKMTLDMRFSASTYARKFLDERLAELKLKLETSEKQLI